MPGSFLTQAQQDRLGRFPDEISQEELLTYFMLSDGDLAAACRLRGDHNRLGYVLQLSAVRFMGFVPEDLRTAPFEATRHLARQLDADPQSLDRYGERAQTRTGHLQSILAHLQYRRATPLDLSLLETWLTQRALEHDRPSLLFELACQKLQRDRILRPGLTRIERVVTAAREQAHQETFRRLGSLLTPERTQMLDELLETGPDSGVARLTWLRQSAVSNTPPAILEALEKLVWLREQGVHRWDLTALNPNRRKLLAGLARRQTNQALRRTRAERRYPMLVCLLRQTLTEVIDELLDLYDACLANTHSRAKRALDEHRKQVAKATETKVRIFHLMGRLVLDEAITDEELRQEIYRRISREKLEEEVAEASAIMRPTGLSHFDFLERRYSYLRRFVPAFLKRLRFQSNLDEDPLLEATDILRTLNAEGRRKLPERAPLDFVSKKWKPHVLDGGDHPHRRAWELCLLSELRDALRAGDLHLKNSRRYANPESYLIPRSRWPALRMETREELALPEYANERIGLHRAQLETLAPRIDHLLKGTGSQQPVRVEDGELIVPPLRAWGGLIARSSYRKK